MALKHTCVAALLAAGLASTAAAEPMKVRVDQTVPLRLGASAESVVVGNATIADVAVHDPRTLLVTGKAFGTTNILVLDHAGRTIFSSMVTVAGDKDGQMTIVRGAGTYTYSCNDKCRPTPVVGDAPGHFQDVMTTVAGMATTAKGSGE